MASNFVRQVLAQAGVQVVVVDALIGAENLASVQDVQDQSRFSFVHTDGRSGHLARRFCCCANAQDEHTALVCSATNIELAMIADVERCTHEWSWSTAFQEH